MCKKLWHGLLHRESHQNMMMCDKGIEHRVLVSRYPGTLMFKEHRADVVEISSSTTGKG